MLQASESGLIIDPDRIEGKFEDFMVCIEDLYIMRSVMPLYLNFEDFSKG